MSFIIGVQPCWRSGQFASQPLAKSLKAVEDVVYSVGQLVSQISERLISSSSERSQGEKEGMSHTTASLRGGSSP